MADGAKDILDALESKIPWLSASRSLLLALIAALVIGFVVARSLDSAEVAGVEKSNSALKEQVDLYKAKLQVGSPDEALRKLNDMQAQIDALRPKRSRRLSDADKQALATELAGLTKQIAVLVVFFEGTPEQARYAADFMAVFKSIQLASIGPLSAVAINDEDRGVMVGLLNPSKPSDLALKFIDALRRAGISVSTTIWAMEGVPADTAPDFNLFIGSQ